MLGLGDLCLDDRFGDEKWNVRGRTSTYKFESLYPRI